MKTTALTIAGTDPTGGAGIQADLKTFCTHGVFGMSVITSVVAQNTTGVYQILDLPVSMINAQLDAVFTDIDPDVVKIGMVSNVNIIHAICGKLHEYGVRKIVVDPVMVSTSGGKLLQDDAMEALKEKLIANATLITPNIYEAELLSGISISDKKSMENACNLIKQRYNIGILIKGGHFAEHSDDLLYWEGEDRWLEGAHINTTSTHGTGCTLSAAIAANMAKGSPVPLAVEQAKRYVATLLGQDVHLGKGDGPLDHSYFCEGNCEGN